MDSQKKHIDRYSSQPGSKADPASPFVDKELFSDAELAEVENLDSRLETFQLESPFLHVFKRLIPPDLGEFEAKEAEESREDILEREIDEELEAEAISPELDMDGMEELEAEEVYDELEEDGKEFHEEMDEFFLDLTDEELDDPVAEEEFESIDEEFDEKVNEKALRYFSQLEEFPSITLELSPPPIIPTKNPLSVPVLNPVSFALPPIMGSYWPIITTHPKGREVAYQAGDKSFVGRRGRRFLANRMQGKRYHVGIDLWAHINDQVVACEDGVILSFRFFYKAKSGERTYRILCEHTNLVINYGEVKSSSLKKNGLKVGDTVKAGQVIGFISDTSMLHFEAYQKGTSSPHRWMKHQKGPPAELLNPTKYLLFLQEHGRVGSGRGTQPFFPIPSAGPVFDLKRAVRLNRRYGQKLGWYAHYESIDRFLGFTDFSLSEETFAEAVADWQQSQGLKPDGIVGPNTWARMKTAMRGSQLSVALDLKRAVRLNRHYSQKLGWHEHYESIERFLGFRGMSPSEETLVEAVAAWQKEHGLRVDGVIGPKTWVRMRAAIGIKQVLTLPKPSAKAANKPQGPFGTLEVEPEKFDLPEDARWKYTFTQDDVLWAARFIEGEAGGKAEPDKLGVLWAMFNRYGILTHRGSLWYRKKGGHRTFKELLRKYSTTLQPVLKSSQAAERAMKRKDFVPTGGFYSGTNIPKGQTKRHWRIQNMGWNELLRTSSGLIAERAMKGQLPNPGIGNASEFLSTWIILKHEFMKKGQGEPSEAEWLRYTERRNQDGLKWIGNVEPFNHKGNTYFIKNRRIPGDSMGRRIGDLAPGVVQIKRSVHNSGKKEISREKSLDEEKFFGEIKEIDHLLPYYFIGDETETFGAEFDGEEEEQEADEYALAEEEEIDEETGKV